MTHKSITFLLFLIIFSAVNLSAAMTPQQKKARRDEIEMLKIQLESPRKKGTGSPSKAEKVARAAEEKVKKERTEQAKRDAQAELIRVKRKEEAAILKKAMDLRAEIKDSTPATGNEWTGGGFGAQESVAGWGGHAALVEDFSRQAKAFELHSLLEKYPKIKSKLEKIEKAERIAKEKAERIAKEKAERIAKEKAERIARAEASARQKELVEETIALNEEAREQKRQALIARAINKIAENQKALNEKAWKSRVNLALIALSGTTALAGVAAAVLLWMYKGTPTEKIENNVIRYAVGTLRNTGRWIGDRGSDIASIFSSNAK